MAGQRGRWIGVLRTLAAGALRRRAFPGRSGWPEKAVLLGFFLAGLVLFGALFGSPTEAVEPGGTEARIRDHLAAGEFAPALELARQAATPEERDRWLAQIAQAQAAAGAREASLRTAAGITSDQARAGALSQMAAQPVGNFGGADLADFDSLIDLITSTIAPTSWDQVGGPGSVAPYPSGVLVDTQGFMRPKVKEELAGELSGLWARSAPGGKGDRHLLCEAPSGPFRQKVPVPFSARRGSPLRMVSLPRLEKQVQLCLAAGRRPSDEMLVLAGLRRIQYVFLYPETGDLVLAGPAGDWRIDGEGRIVGSDTGEPVVRLDDLVVVFRLMLRDRQERFGCLITPRQESLARVQEFVQASGQNPIRSPQERKAWLDELRSQLGTQDIDVYGIDARTRAARVMVEADYRMKLVGMGLEQGVPGVVSYLDLVEIAPGQGPPPMGVLRWWFTLNYDAVLAAPDRQGFAVRGQGVKVLSENERLSAEGKRIHTGRSEEWNRQFARSFTEHFGELCRQYPIYAELRNLFDLALAAALVREEDLAGKVGWHLTCFGDSNAYPVPLAPAPKTVESVINYRIVHRVHIVAGVSGGVRVDASDLAKRYAMETDSGGKMDRQRSAAASAIKALPTDAWWWD